MRARPPHRRPILLGGVNLAAKTFTSLSPQMACVSQPHRSAGPAFTNAAGRFMTTTNGGPTPSAIPGNVAEFGVMAQYIKDFSFENPNAPRSLAPMQQQPQINVQVNVSPKPLSTTDYEVELRIDGKAEVSGMVLFS